MESGLCWTSQNHMTHSVESGLSLSHCWDNCEFSSRNKLQQSDHPRILPSMGQGTWYKLICFQWNENVFAMCPYSNCKFQHMCYTCTHNPAVTNVVHLALYCLKCHCLSTSLAASDISLNLSCKFETSHKYINN